MKFQVGLLNMVGYDVKDLAIIWGIIMDSWNCHVLHWIHGDCKLYVEIHMRTIHICDWIINFSISV